MINNTLFGIIGIACFAVLFSEASGAVDAIKWWLFRTQASIQRLKPLDCPMCLSFWIGLCYALFSLPVSITYGFYSLLFASTCSIISILISKAIKP
jgi:hypothetical protein